MWLLFKNGKMIRVGWFFIRRKKWLKYDILSFLYIYYKGLVYIEIYFPHKEKGKGLRVGSYVYFVLYKSWDNPIISF